MPKQNKNAENPRVRNVDCENLVFADCNDALRDFSTKTISPDLRSDKQKPPYTMCRGLPLHGEDGVKRPNTCVKCPALNALCGSHATGNQKCSRSEVQTRFWGCTRDNAALVPTDTTVSPVSTTRGPSAKHRNRHRQTFRGRPRSRPNPCVRRQYRALELTMHLVEALIRRRGNPGCDCRHNGRSRHPIDCPTEDGHSR